MSIKKLDRVSAIMAGLTLTSVMLAGNSYGGIIQNSNQDMEADAFKGDCGNVGEPTACVGAWNLNNVDVNLKSADGTVFGSFDKETGAYTPMTPGDSFESLVRDFGGEMMARITGKVWPVGEPTAVKAIVNDPNVSKGKPQNCIINTSFLSPEDSTLEDANFLDSAHPQPVICSSPFQTHKRLKIAMQPATVDGVLAGDGHGIDLVFNVVDDGTLRSYQVFSKINNYTGKRLSGYKIVVGTGVGTSFVSASEQGIADKLHISLGKGEGATGGASNTTYDGSDIFHADSLATFSHGLFGAPDNHFSKNGFFDMRTAGFNVEQDCKTAPAIPCPTYDNPLYTNTLVASDTIYSTAPLESNYHGPVIPDPTTGLPFGEWLPSIWQPKGVFFDDDQDPTTDAVLTTWWDGAQWRGNYDSGFQPFTQEEINWFADNPNGQYEMSNIEDVLNLGINYIVKVGDGIPEGKLTIRIIPVVAANQNPPTWCDPECTMPPFGDGGNTTPVPDPDTPVIPEPPAPPVYEDPIDNGDGGNGGGCAIGNDGSFDPTLPAVLLAGLAFFSWRRQKARD